MNGIHHMRTAPYSPKTNGSAENFVRTFKGYLRKMKHNSLTIDSKIVNFLLSYRTTPHSATKETPAKAMFGRELRTKFTLVHPNLSNEMEKRHPSRHSSHKLRSFEIGDPVEARDYRSPNSWRRGAVVRKLGPVTYEVQVGGVICVKTRILPILCSLLCTFILHCLR